MEETDDDFCYDLTPGDVALQDRLYARGFDPATVEWKITSATEFIYELREIHVPSHLKRMTILEKKRKEKRIPSREQTRNKWKHLIRRR